jgi:hypothetical protein
MLNDVATWTELIGHAQLRSFVDDEGHFWLEQNSTKQSKWAKLAREGHDVALEFAGRGGSCTGRMLVDDKLYTPSAANPPRSTNEMPDAALALYLSAGKPAMMIDVTAGEGDYTLSNESSFKCWTGAKAPVEADGYSVRGRSIPGKTAILSFVFSTQATNAVDVSGNSEVRLFRSGESYFSMPFYDAQHGTWLSISSRAYLANMHYMMPSDMYNLCKLLAQSVLQSKPASN